jgi:hypothetical protein
MSFDKPSSSAHWHSLSARTPDRQDKPESSSPAQPVWGQLPRVLNAQGSVTPLAISNLSFAAGSTETRRYQQSSDTTTHASSIANFPPLGANTTARFSSSRRSTPPTPFQSSNPIQNLQAGAIQHSSSLNNRPFSSPRSRTISPLQSAGGSASFTHQGPGAAGGGGGFTSRPRSGAYSPSLTGSGVGSPTAPKYERSSSVSSNPGSATSAQSSFSKISATQIVLLVDTITEKKGKAEFESKVEKINKVCIEQSVSYTC